MLARDWASATRSRYPRRAALKIVTTRSFWEVKAGVGPAGQVHVSRLRAALANGSGGKDRLQTTAGGYLLRVESGELDAERFERLLEEGGAKAR